MVAAPAPLRDERRRSSLPASTVKRGEAANEAAVWLATMADARSQLFTLAFTADTWGMSAERRGERKEYSVE
jgi:hypothetical protein